MSIGSDSGGGIGNGGLGGPGNGGGGFGFGGAGGAFGRKDGGAGGGIVNVTNQPWRKTLPPPGGFGPDPVPNPTPNPSGGNPPGGHFQDAGAPQAAPAATPPASPPMGQSAYPQQGAPEAQSYPATGALPVPYGSTQRTKDPMANAVAKPRAWPKPRWGAGGQTG